MDEIKHIFLHSLMITLFVFVMMVLVDYINVLTRGKMSKAIKGSQGRQYVIASFLGATPGCLGAFLNVSFYIHGLLTFGAMVGGMIATSGDEAFVMLALFPEKALLLFALLFSMGIVFGWLTDKIAAPLHIIPCEGCELYEVHEGFEANLFDLEVVKSNLTRFSWYRTLILGTIITIFIIVISGVFDPLTWGWKQITFLALLLITAYVVITVPDHYLEEHIWTHVFKKHIWRIFLWSFFALLFIELGLKHWNLEGFVKQNMIWVLLIGALVGIIPDSGPHLIFVMMFAQGMIPFSVLLVSSFVQDGHGMLPLLSYTLRDSILIKLFNLFFALAVGGIIFYLGF
ncbi:MAG: putative manganese transporter [Candidatus Zixiibacteriota bacterium]